MKCIIAFFVICFTCVAVVKGQILDEYITTGLESNLELRSSEKSEEVALQALDVAKRMKTVRLDFNPTYTTAVGGRTIDIPVGDLLNPVYGTLNDLTASDQFLTIENVSELLNPSNFYDVKVSATYPIINKSIDVNEGIRALETEIAHLSTDQYKLRLINDITAAYYDVQVADRAIEILQDATSLIDENTRVNRGLFNEGKVLWTDVLAAENDSIQLEKDIQNAIVDYSVVTAYLNFLVNRPLETPVSRDTSIYQLPEILLLSQAQKRPELEQLEALEDINSKLEELEKTKRSPQLNVFADVGMQNFDFRVDGSTPYLLAGLTLNLNVYDGGQTKSQMLLARKKRDEVTARRLAIDQQIQLELYAAKKATDKSRIEYEAIQKEVVLRNRQYTDQLKKYKYGKTNYITVQESRNKLVQTKLNSNIILFQAWKEVADLKSALAIL